MTIDGEMQKMLGPTPNYIIRKAKTTKMIKSSFFMAMVKNTGIPCFRKFAFHHLAFMKDVH